MTTFSRLEKCLLAHGLDGTLLANYYVGYAIYIAQLLVTFFAQKYRPVCNQYKVTLSNHAIKSRSIHNVFLCFCIAPPHLLSLNRDAFKPLGSFTPRF